VIHILRSRQSSLPFAFLALIAVALEYLFSQLNPSTAISALS
jgi:hypothetical protein